MEEHDRATVAFYGALAILLGFALFIIAQVGVRAMGDPPLTDTEKMKDYADLVDLYGNISLVSMVSLFLGALLSTIPNIVKHDELEMLEYQARKRGQSATWEEDIEQQKESVRKQLQEERDKKLREEGPTLTPTSLTELEERGAGSQ